MVSHFFSATKVRPCSIDAYPVCHIIIPNLRLSIITLSHNQTQYPVIRKKMELIVQRVI